MTRVGDWLRQRRYPAEFRIDAPALPVPVTVETVPAPAPEGVPEPQPEPAVEAPAKDPSDLSDDVLAALATDLWRARRKLGDGQDRDAPRAQRQAARHLGGVWDRLADAGVEIQEHDGAPFDLGMMLDVLAYQADTNVTKETVLETVRPSVYRGERCIQVGEVIVAVPEKEQGDGSRDH